MENYEPTDVEHKPPPKDSAGCTTVVGFYIRLACYVAIGVTAAVAAAAEAAAVKNSKDAWGGDNKCPFTFDYGSNDQKRVSTCGFIRFIAIFSTVVAWLMLAFTAYKIYSSSFKLRKSVVIELVLAGFALCMTIIAGALATTGNHKFCDRIGSGKKLCLSRINRSEASNSYKKMAKDMFLVEETLWVTAMFWGLLFGVLLWRACVACKSGETEDITFDNPNAAEAPAVV
eukprot:m.149646 g.149646  ORF g.149646 m.149646 type:complete len:229 (-) comp16299_c2_seq1:2392-3078(-)